MTACHVKKENTQWKTQLAELNDAIRSSVSDEEWEDVGELHIEQDAPKITDQERVYLVGVQVKSRKKDAESFTGVIHDPESCSWASDPSMPSLSR